MADTAAPAAAAPAAAAPVATNGDPAKPAGDVATSAPPEKAPDQDRDLLKSLTKQSAEARKANALVAELTKKLEAATGGATETQKKAEMWEAVKKNPRLLLEHGLTWDNILDSISGKEETPPDPRLEALAKENAEIKARIDAREKAEQDAKDAAAKAQQEAQQAAALAKVMEIVGAEGDTPDADGLGRWELVSSEPALIQEAIDEVVKWMDGEVGGGRAKGFTQEQALGFVREHLDTYEKAQREKKPKLVAKLKANPTVSGKDDSSPKVTKPSTKPRAELPPDRFTIDASTAGDPPPVALKKSPDRPKTTAAPWTRDR